MLVMMKSGSFAAKLSKRIEKSNTVKKREK